MKWRYANQQMKAIAISLSKSIRPCDLGVCVMVCSPPLRLKSVSCRSVFTGYLKSVVTAYFCACVRMSLNLFRASVMSTGV